MTDSLGAREFVAGLVQGSAGAVCGDRKPEINAGEKAGTKTYSNIFEGNASSSFENYLRRFLNHLS